MWSYIIWGIILLVIISILVRMRSLFSIYVCPKCRHEYTLTPVKEFLFPQVMYRKLSRCPSCKRFVAAGIIRNEETVAKAEALQNNKKNVRTKKSKKS